LVLKLCAKNLRIGRTNGFGGVVVWIGLKIGGVVNVDATHGEIALDLTLRGHGIDHGVRHYMPEPLIVDEEERPSVSDGTAERCAEVILHQVIVPHGIKGVGVHEIAAQKLIDRAMKAVAAAAGDDIDLAAPSPTHLG